MDGEKYISLDDLELYVKAKELRKYLAQVAKGLPSDEEFRLSDQIIRAARSISANIAEGYGRYHYKETIQFCRQARGSLYEVLDHISVASEEDFINEREYQNIQQKVFELIKLANGYIKYLQQQKRSNINNTSQSTNLPISEST